MILSLDIQPARKGDCFLLHFGSKENPKLAIIDGGPAAVYKPFLKDRLNQVRTARNIRSQEPLMVDLLMVSHVDDDHIRGILDLTKEMIDGNPLRLKVLRFWHNSFDSVLGKSPQELHAQFGTAATSEGLSDNAWVESPEDDEVILWSIKALASLEQGNRLQGDSAALHIPLNPEFGGKLIMAGEKPKTLSSQLAVTIAGPMQPELQALQNDYDKWLKTRKQSDDGGPEAAYVDKSVPNLSSIVVLARAGEKSILLTGDARGDKILAGLEMVGVMERGGTLDLDILKVPHHGSSNNLDNDFFTRIRARHYVFSGDGEHGNPERETLEMLLRARGDHPFTIHLTYPMDHIDEERRKDWEKEQGKEGARKAKGSKKPVRTDWSDEKNGLVTLFEKHPLKSGQEIVFNLDGNPHVIDLLDPLGY